MDQEKLIAQLKQEGYSNISVVTLRKNDSFHKEHSHFGPTAHIILKGELIITDALGTKTYKEGERVNFPAGTKHVATCGSQGCTMIVGFKEEQE